MEDAHYQPVYTERKIRTYHCFKCGHNWTPHAREPEKNKFFPKKCRGCGSKKWSIPVAYIGECIRCGFFWDLRKLTDTKKCPSCGRTDYRRADWERQINYNKELVEQEKKASKRRKALDKLGDFHVEQKNVKFEKHVSIELEDSSVLERLE